MTTIEQKRLRIIEVVPKLPANLREQIYNKLESYPRTYNARCYYFNLMEVKDEILDDIYDLVTLHMALESTDHSNVLDDEAEAEDEEVEEEREQTKKRKPDPVVDDGEDIDLIGNAKKKKGKFENWLEKSRAKAKKKRPL